MQKPVSPSRLLAAMILIPVALAATSAHAETVILECVAAPDENLCDSRWVIDGDTGMVTWHWCESPDTTERRNVHMTRERISFDEDFMERHYEFDRITGRMSITAVAMSLNGQPGERFDDGEAICRTVGK